MPILVKMSAICLDLLNPIICKCAPFLANLIVGIQLSADVNRVHASLGSVATTIFWEERDASFYQFFRL